MSEVTILQFFGIKYLSFSKKRSMGNICKSNHYFKLFSTLIESWITSKKINKTYLGMELGHFEIVVVIVAVAAALFVVEQLFDPV